jgi:hypothetical protein
MPKFHPPSDTPPRIIVRLDGNDSTAIVAFAQAGAPRCVSAFFPILPIS